MFPAPLPGYELLVDVSVAQGPLAPHLPALQAAGVRGVIARATDGLHTVDPQWAATRDACAGEGMPLSAYGVVEPGSDPVAQAQHFLDVISGAPVQRRVVDFEVAKGMTAAAALQGCAAYARAIFEVVGTRPTIYTSPSFMGGLRRLARIGEGAPRYDDATTEALVFLASCPLWLALWPSTSWDRPDVHGWPLPPEPWASTNTCGPELWQSTGGAALIPGTSIRVDVDWIRASAQEPDPTIEVEPCDNTWPTGAP